MVDELTVVTLQVSSAVGAAVLGAKAASLTLPIDYQANTKLLEQCKFKERCEEEEKMEGEGEGEKGGETGEQS